MKYCKLNLPLAQYLCGNCIPEMCVSKTKCNLVIYTIIEASKMQLIFVLSFFLDNKYLT